MTRTTRAMMPLFFPRRARGPAARGEALKIIVLMKLIIRIIIRRRRRRRRRSRRRRRRRIN